MMEPGGTKPKNQEPKNAPPSFNSKMASKVRRLELEKREKELKYKLDKLNKSVELEEVREKGKQDLYFFCKTVMGFKDLYEPLHRPLCDFISNPKSKRKLLLIPRGHFKTTICSISYPIWKLINNPEERIALVSVTSDLSEDNLRELIMKIDDPRFQSLYGHILPPTKTWPLRRGFEYRCPRRGAKVGPTFYSCGVESSETGRHFSTMLIDDMVNDTNTRSRNQLDKIWDWFGRQESVLDSTGEFCVIGCLTGDSKVLMSDGTWRIIEDVEPGEEVYSYKDGKAVPKMVEAMWPQGKADIVKVKTVRGNVRCTPNHPFLVKRKSVKYVKAENLIPGDEIITGFKVETNNIGGQVTLDERLSERKYSYRFVNEKDMWLFGFIIGDGWVAKSKKRYHGVVISRKVDETKNKRIVSELKRWSKAKVSLKVKERYYRVECGQAARELERLSLDGKSKTKRIPEWVYRESLENRVAFLRGLCDADGHKCRGPCDSFRLGLSNKALIEDVIDLCRTSGVRTGKVSYQDRWVQPPCSPKPVYSEVWSITMNFAAKGSISEEFITSPVVSVEPCGREEVFDLSVEDTHNFIINGFSQKNTRWHWGDPYGRIQELDGWNKMILSATDKKGKVIFPTLFSKKKLENIKRTQGEYRYSCFYENNPSGEGTNPFEIRKFSWVDYKDQSPGSWRYILVDPATTTNEWSHPTGIVVGDAQAKDKNFVVVDSIREKLKPDDLVTRIVNLCKKHEPRQVIIESDSAHATFVFWVRQKMRDLNLNYHVKNIKNPVRIGRETRTINILQPRLHNGNIVLSDHMNGKKMLMEEFASFPKGKTDDLIMALAAVDTIKYPPSHNRPMKQELDKRTRIFNSICDGHNKKRRKRRVPKTRMGLWA